MLLIERRKGCRLGVACKGGRDCEPEECLEGAEILAGLRFTSWASTVAVAPASSGAVICKVPCPKAMQEQREASEDDGESDDEEYRPSKVRVIQMGDGGSPIILPRRSYTWRGASRRLQQQEGAAESTGFAPAAAAAAAATARARHPAVPAMLSAGAALAPALRPSCGAGASPAGPAPVTSRASSAAAAGASSTKEGDKEWAALTTWLRMNLHNPRTAKKVVLFVGQREAEAGQWCFDLNPALTWAEVSTDTKLRLRDLLHETQEAFRRKYPARPSGDWARKSQKYTAPGSSQTFQVPLAQLVMSLHEMYQRFEGGVGPISSSGSHDSDLTAAGALPAPVPASPTISHNS